MLGFVITGKGVGRRALEVTFLAQFIVFTIGAVEIYSDYRVLIAREAFYLVDWKSVSENGYL